MSNTQNLAIGLNELSHFKAKQDLENAEKFQPKGSTDLTGAVRYDAVQVLTDVEQAQARANIGAAAPGEGGGTAEGAVLYEEQTLTDEQKVQARENIGTTDGSWASMPDKPFGEGDSIVTEIPSDISGLTVISSQSLESAGGVAFSYVKVGSQFSSANEVIGAKVSATTSGTDINFEVASSHIIDVGNGFAILYIGDQAYLPACLNINSVGTSTIPSEEAIGEDLVINVTEEGLYFLRIEGLGQINSLTRTEVKKLDEKFLPDGLVTTDENGLIPSSVLPSYVDDAIEGYLNSEDSLFYEEAEFTTAITGESGKIYVDLNSSNTYRWSGSQYVQLNPPEITFATTSDIDALFT